MLVVHRPVVVIAENFVRLRDGFEFDVGLLPLFFGYFVGVGSERSLKTSSANVRNRLSHDVGPCDMLS